MGLDCIPPGPQASTLKAGSEAPAGSALLWLSAKCAPSEDVGADVEKHADRRRATRVIANNDHSTAVAAPQASSRCGVAPLARPAPPEYIRRRCNSADRRRLTPLNRRQVDLGQIARID
jgi:hypothetical protein